jgi:murein DD-endopeptidase MepM/ murein hydrolase activator NlpD
MIVKLREWRSLEQASLDIHQVLLQRAPSAIAGAIPPLEPTQSPSAIARLVNSEIIQNPQSEAFTADLYLETTLQETVPWPNVGGRAAVLSYTVDVGDTLYGIAYNHDLDFNTLLWANPTIDPTNPIIRIGEQLRILPVQGVYHVVSEGETVDDIAARYGVFPTHITNYPPNQMTKPFTITAGTGLIVPYGRQALPGEPIPPLVVDSPLAWPLVGLVSKGFHPQAHPGIQISAPPGTIVQAAGDGTVRSINDNQGGSIIVIEHADKLESWYSHLQATTVKPGDSVMLGNDIGKVDSEGVGSYLYFAVYEKGEAVDPLEYLPGGVK